MMCLDEPINELLSPVLSATWRGSRVSIRPEAASQRLWLEDVGADPPWRDLLDGDRQVWRAAPSRASRCWIVAGLRRPPSPSQIGSVRVRLPDQAWVDASISEQAWLAVLPPDAGVGSVTVMTYGPDDEVLDVDRLRDLRGYLGSFADTGGWTQYAPW